MADGKTNEEDDECIKKERELLKQGILHDGLYNNIMLFDNMYGQKSPLSDKRGHMH